MKRGAWLFFAFTCGCAPKNAAKHEDRAIEMLITSDAETLDPRYAVDTVGMRVTRLVHAGLVRLDPTTLAPMPYLAREWRWLDPATLHLTLRDDVRFHSGAAFTSRDVVATLRAFGSSAVASRLARVVDAIASCDPDGDYGVIIRLRRAHATLLTDLELPILRADEATSPPAPEGRLDGLGPFVVRESEPGRIELTPARDGALPEPKHAVILRTVHDENARALRLYAGNADVAVNALSPTLLPAIEQERDLAVVSRTGANLTYLLLRTDRPPLDRVDVRRAIARAIDRATIAATLLAGHAQVADTLLPPSHWAYTAPAAPAFTFDPAAPKLALHLSLLTSTDRLRGTIARLLAQELNAIGVDVDVTPLELGTMIARLNAGDFDLATLQLPELTEPNVLRVFMHSTSIPPNGANRGRIHDPEVDALLDEGDRETDPEARRRIYAKLDARVQAQAFLIPLWHEDQVAIVSARARSFTPSSEGRWLSLATLP